jgi:hypothetical protein
MPDLPRCFRSCPEGASSREDEAARRRFEEIGTADELVEAMAEDLPGGGTVNQMWDVVLMPGRFGLRVATTVLKRGETGD